MRFSRLIVAVFTTAALAVPTAALDTASAVTTKTTVSQKAPATPPAAPLLTRIFRHTKIVNITPTRLQMRTKVLNYQFQPTFLQRKVCRGCVWQHYSSRRTNGTGRVYYPVGYPARGKWYWRIGTPARARYRTSYSPVWNTFAR